MRIIFANGEFLQVLAAAVVVVAAIGSAAFVVFDFNARLSTIEQGVPPLPVGTVLPYVGTRHSSYSDRLGFVWFRRYAKPCGQSADRHQRTRRGRRSSRTINPRTRRSAHYHGRG